MFLPSGTGLQRAVREVFGEGVAIQRCLATKLSQVTDPLPEAVRGDLRQRLRQAWALSDAAAAEQALHTIHAAVRPLNHSAGKALMRGLSDTLTVQRTGLLLQSAKSLRVIHCMDQLRSRLHRALPVAAHPDERLAHILMDYESRQHRIAHWQRFPALQEALLALTS